MTPTAPTLPEDAPLGSTAARMSAQWSDGSQFTGSYVFTTPYNDDGGTFAISGDSIIINPAGLGISGDGGTTQNISVVAVQ